MGALGGINYASPDDSYTSLDAAYEEINARDPYSRAFSAASSSLGLLVSAPASAAPQSIPPPPLLLSAALAQPGVTSMKGPKLLLILGVLFAGVLAFGQTDSVIHVKTFPGTTVAQKVTAAMATCQSAPVPCILTIDASLAAAPSGTMPTLCANCFLYDFRDGPPSRTADWYDRTGACKVYRGTLNIRDCGGVADGAWTSGNWTGTDNYAAIAKALTTLGAAGGGTLYFPPTGTNIYMAGNASECSSGILFSVPNNVTIEGAAQLTTTIMAGESTGHADCWMFQNKDQPEQGIVFRNIRIDGNLPTSSSHNSTLHPNNNGASDNALLGAINSQSASSQDTDTANISLRHVQVTGFAGNPVAGNPTAIYAGPDGSIQMEFDSVFDNSATGIFIQGSDSSFIDDYWQVNLGGTGPGTIIWGAGSNRFTDNYWGGSFGTQVQVQGGQNNFFIGCVNDSPGSGQNYQFENQSSTASTGNQIIGGQISNTTAAHPAVTFEGNASHNLISGVTFTGSTSPSYLVQELGSADYTSIISPQVEVTPGVSRYLLIGIHSYAFDDLGLAVGTTAIVGTAGSATCGMAQGTVKQVSCYLSAYAQTGTAQTYTFPSAFETDPILLESGGSCGTYNPSVTATKLTLPANAGMTAETCNVVVMGQ